jgi:hypothetical protein
MIEATQLVPGTEARVRLLKDPRPDVVYPGEVLHDDGEHAVIQAPWFGDVSHDMGFALFEPGDVWIEHYWRSRWFTVKEVRAADGTVKGWYCDMTKPPRVEDGVLLVRDLELDVWLSGDGSTVLRLDEDEFEESGLEQWDPEAAAIALRTMAEVEELARDGGLVELLKW